MCYCVHACLIYIQMQVLLHGLIIYKTQYIQTRTIVLIIFNKGLTYNVTKKRYEVITHVYKGYHSAFSLIIYFMNEIIFKPRHTCTDTIIFFSHRDRYNENKHTCCFRFEQTAHSDTHNVNVTYTIAQNQSDEFVSILKGWIRLTFVSSF